MSRYAIFRRFQSRELLQLAVYVSEILSQWILHSVKGRSHTHKTKVKYKETKKVCKRNEMKVVCDQNRLTSVITTMGNRRKEYLKFLNFRSKSFPLHTFSAGFYQSSRRARQEI